MLRKINYTLACMGLGANSVSVVFLHLLELNYTMPVVAFVLSALAAGLNYES